MALANWGVSIERAGFKGSTSVGGIYDWERRHRVEFSVGEYNINKSSHRQYNLGYKYSPWVRGQKIKWYPLQVGIYGLYADRAPEKDLQWRLEFPPYRDYHELNIFKLGLQLGSAHSFSNDQFELSYHVMILDNGLDALTRNIGEDLRYFVSTGLGLHYHF